MSTVEEIASGIRNGTMSIQEAEIVLLALTSTSILRKMTIEEVQANDDMLEADENDALHLDVLYHADTVTSEEHRRLVRALNKK